MCCPSVCVSVFFPFILDIKFVGRTSRGHTGGRSHRISHPPSFCGTCLNFSREKDSAIPFPRRPWSRIWCTNDLIVLHPLGILFLHMKKLRWHNKSVIDLSNVNPACGHKEVCVCFLPIHSGHQVRWTYQLWWHRRKVTQDFSSTLFLRCVP